MAGTFTANNALGSNYIWSNGNIVAGGQVQANYDATLGTAGGSANIGWGCSPNGAIAANANGSGQVLACQGGTWQAMGSAPTQFFQNSYGGGSVQIPGYWQVCTTSGGNNAIIGAASGPYNNNTYIWDAYSGNASFMVDCWNW